MDAFSSTRDGTARSGIFYGPFAGPFGSFVAQVGKSEVRLGFGPSVDYSPDGSVRGPVHPRPKDGRPGELGRVGTVRSLGGDPRTPGWLRKRPRPSSAQGWTRCQGRVGTREKPGVGTQEPPVGTERSHVHTPPEGGRAARAGWAPERSLGKEAPNLKGPPDGSVRGRPNLRHGLGLRFDRVGSEEAWEGARRSPDGSVRGPRHPWPRGDGRRGLAGWAP